MTDEVITTIPTTVEAAPIAPVVTETPTVAPTTVETPSVATEAPVEAKPVTKTDSTSPTTSDAKPQSTVLGEALAPAEQKVETPEVKPEVKTEEGQSAEPAPPPVYDAFKLPENVTMDEARTKEFTDILGNLELDLKADHGKMQEFGQKAVDYHLKEVQRTMNELSQQYLKSWEDTKLKWRESFMSDPELGGNRFQTTIDSALNFIRTHGGSDSQQAEFRSLMDETGLGNHPVMIRILANAGRTMSEGKPLAATQPVSGPKSKAEILYGKRKVN